MPYKTCKKCNTQNGVRAKTCSNCKSEFQTKKIKKGKVDWSAKIDKLASGEWQDDKTIKGMPEIEKSEPIKSDNKVEIEEIKRYIEYEGLGFAILHGIPTSAIKDTKLRKLWEKSRNSMTEIVKYLE